MNIAEINHFEGTLTSLSSFSVQARYVDHENIPDLPVPSLQWYFEHVQQSQYCLRIIKCNDVKCCGHKRTNYNEIFPTRFILAPVPFVNNESGITSALLEVELAHTVCCFRGLIAPRWLEPAHNYSVMPFDLYCPSVPGLIQKRLWNHCGKYFQSLVAVKGYKIIH